MTRNERARISLDGLSVGDAFGERFAGLGIVGLLDRRLPPPPWITTDDTEMACEIVAQLESRQAIEQDELALRFARRFHRDPGRGYGPGAMRILRAIEQGRSWREAAGSAFRGQGSMGNGSAMRVAPLGAWFAEDLDALIREARASAEVTHAHPDAQVGAMAVALAAAWAVRKPEAGLLEFVLQHLPGAGPTRAGIEQSLTLAEAAPFEAAQVLGNGSMILSSDTVPLCLWLAARYSHDYAAALWVTAGLFGDVDTNCAIVGGIVALRAPPPPGWIAAREPLDLEKGTPAPREAR